LGQSLPLSLFIFGFGFSSRIFVTSFSFSIYS
jgi:hypothetical protein